MRFHFFPIQNSRLCTPSGLNSRFLTPLVYFFSLFLLTWHRWISVGSDLKFDARRDLDDVGATCVEGKNFIFDHLDIYFYVKFIWFSIFLSKKVNWIMVI